MEDSFSNQQKQSMSCRVGGTVNALSLCRDSSRIVVAGRSLLKIFSIDETTSNFKGDTKLYFARQGNSVNYSDVAWCPNNESLIATASTNGTVTTWDLGMQTRNKQLTSFNNHQRCVTKISFHPNDCQKLLSGSQDDTMKIFDLRLKKEAHSFDSYGNGVRNVQFNPSNHFQFAASFDNGNVQIWDYRNNKSAHLQFIAHDRFVYALEWHPDPEKRNVLATGGSDKTVKVWDITHNDRQTNDISSTSAVACVRWRPNRPEQLATTALGSTALLDYYIYVWDLRRRFVPFAYFDSYRSAQVGIEWKHNDPSVMFSCSNDGLLRMHTIREASRPGDDTETRGFDFSSMGFVCVADEDYFLSSPRSQSPVNYRLPSFFPSSLKSSTSDLDDIYSSSSSLSYTGSTSKMKRFLKNQSNLKMISKFSNLLKSCQNASDYLEPKDTVLEHLFMSGFRHAAQKYILDGHALDKTFDEVCQHNSEVAFAAGMANAGRTWLLLAQFYPNPNDNSLLYGKNNNGVALPRNYSDIITDKGKSNGIENKRPSLTLKQDDFHGSQVFTIATSGAESEIHSEDGRNEIEDYLTVIAKGRPTDHFYISDDEANPSFGYDGVTSEADFFTDQEWSATLQVPSEAIVQKEVLDTDSIANFGHVDVPLAVANQSVTKRTILTPHGGRWHETVAQLEPESSSPSPPADSDADTLTEKDLIVKPSLWPDPLQSIRDDLIYKQLGWFAEQNDVQTAVSMLLVLSSYSILCNFPIDEDLLEHWQLSYLHLLAKYQLWVPHETVIKLSKTSSIREMSTSSNVYIYCKTCSRRTPNNSSWSCDRRFDAYHTNQSSICFFCHLPVIGLYTYCQSCCMGGHLKCVEKWTKRKKGGVCRSHCI